MASRWGTFPALQQHCEAIESLKHSLNTTQQKSEEEKVGAQVAVFKSRIWDVNQKSLYLQDNQLVAGYLQGPNSALEEKIYWVHNDAFDHQKFPVILSIQDGQRCLACSPGAWPSLQLESINITDLHRDGHEASTRFTFLLSSRDGIWQFESAAHPGWFLCTSTKTSEPLGLTQDPGPSHVYREERFRMTSESTNQRVLWWSIAQTVILILTGIWQMRHLKSFFEAKKLV
ncbi:hypothetical protein JD844_030875 [Phrynosoma platyrhinos]|uniref:Interleukin-1 receptor antagonist protein n=1 Tax=Phrynosoma platyrhinos TaxID=52577 RepID=A0ABQ7SZT8_PHRPL|nr:hypothetical protein JD844_030875 [Phrynosoma platyrhinos]